MARFVKKLGTASVRYLFDLTLHEVDIRVPYVVNVGVVLIRGDKRMQSKLEPQVCSENSKANFNDEKLQIVCSMYKDKQTGVF
jgi:hypothetical protein